MQNLESQLELFRQIDSEFAEILYECFPGLKLDGQGQSGPQFHAHMHEENKHFYNTEYYYKGSLEFFHLTNVENLLSMLNSRTVRLYNLHHSDDEEEYRYVGNILELPEERINYSKKYLYTFSFCPSSELQNKTVWEIYGKNLGGVAIVFKIENNPFEWVKFHISEVKYQQPESYDLYSKKIKELQQKYNGITLWCDLSQLICFHKTPKWDGEREVRIATYFPYKNEEEYLKYSKPAFRLQQGRNRISKYIELPLWVDNDSSLVKSYGNPELDRTQILQSNFFDTRPKIKIENILFGKNCGIAIEEFDQFRTTLQELIRFNYGYSIALDYNFFEV